MGCGVSQKREALSDWQTEADFLQAEKQEKIELPSLKKAASLDDYILYAMLNNPGLRAAFNRWLSALKKVRPARTLPDPRFNYTYYVREVETRVGPQKHKFGLAQTFPWLGKLDLQGKMALQEVNASRQRYESEKLRLIFQVKNTYFEYWYLFRSINITKDNVSLISHFEDVARAKYRSGTGLQSAVIKTQVELGKLTDRLDSLKDMIRPMTAKLNLVLNRPLTLPLPPPETLPEVSHNFFNNELRGLLKKQNPDLKAIDFMADKETLAVRLANKSFFPDVTLGVDYVKTDPRTDIHPADNGEDPVMAMVSINVPIWHLKYNALADDARARHRAFIAQRKEKENTLIADLEMALYQLRDADRKMDLYKHTLIPMAEQNVKINQAAFAADKVGFLDLIDAQRVLLNFQLEYDRARADRAQKISRIEMLTGEGSEGSRKINLHSEG